MWVVVVAGVLDEVDGKWKRSVLHRRRFELQ